MYYISVDCGGTKTAFLLADEKGNEIARTTLGPGNFYVTGVETVTDNIRQGVNELCEKAKISKDEIAYALIAAAGYNTKRGNKEFDEAAKAKFDFKYIVTGDTANAMKGSLLDKQGIHLISGTGSIGKGTFGHDKNGSTIGGWGYYCGSDEGSGYWIGAKLIWHFERQADGREKRTLVYDYLMNKFKLSDPSQMVNVIVNELKNERDQIATLAVDVANLCKQGDETAKQIMFEAGQELGLIAKTIYEKDQYDLPVTISYSGSVFNSVEFLKPGIEDSLKDISHIFREPILSPLTGGILLAMEFAGKEYNDEIVENLKKIK